MKQSAAGGALWYPVTTTMFIQFNQLTHSCQSGDQCRFGPSAQAASNWSPLDPGGLEVTFDRLGLEVTRHLYVQGESLNRLSPVGGACHQTNASCCRLGWQWHTAPSVPSDTSPDCCLFLYPMMPCRSCGKSTVNSRGRSRRR